MRRVRLEEARCPRKYPSRRSRAIAPAGWRPSSGPLSGTACSVFMSTGTSRRLGSASGLLEPVPDAVERLDHVEAVVGRLELLAQPLDVAVDGAVVHVDL